MRLTSFNGSFFRELNIKSISGSSRLSLVLIHLCFSDISLGRIGMVATSLFRDTEIMMGGWWVRYKQVVIR